MQTAKRERVQRSFPFFGDTAFLTLRTLKKAEMRALRRTGKNLPAGWKCFDGNCLRDGVKSDSTRFDKILVFFNGFCYAIGAAGRVFLGFPRPLPYMLSLDLPAGTDLRWDGFDFAADGIGKGERYGTG